MAQSILKNVLAKGFLNVFNILVPFLITPFVYRILGPEIVGKVEYGTTIYNYFGLLGALGIYNYGLREISRNRNNQEKVKTIYKNLFLIGLISNLFFFVIYEFFVFFLINDTQLKQIMYVLSINLLSQVFYIEWINEAYEDFRFITIKTVVIRSISVVAIILLVTLPSDYIFYVFIIVIVLFLNNIISFIRAQKHIKIGFNFLSSNHQLKKYLIPLLLILILNNTNILYTMLDRTMLGIYSGVKEVAYYSIGQKIAETSKLLLLTIIYVTLPRLSLYLETNKTLYFEGVKKLIRLILLLVLPISIGMFMLSEQIVFLFAGSQYTEAIPSLQIFALRIVFLAIEAILYNQIIFLHRKENVLIIINLLCGGLNVLLKYAILSYLNPMTAIVTTLITEILFQILCLIYIKRNLHISTGLFEKGNLKYLFMSLLFIPIIKITQAVIVNQFLFVLISILLCFALYIFGLHYSNDSTYNDLKIRLKLNK